jgi:hypothetical protein
MTRDVVQGVEAAMTYLLHREFDLGALKQLRRTI